MRVMLVSGSLPPEVCGVGDYSARLAEALRERGISVRLESAGDRTRASAAYRSLLSGGADIVHVQYPSIGYGRRFWPHVLSTRARTRAAVVLTLHEYAAAHPARRAAALALAVSSDRLVFVEPVDRAAVPYRKAADAPVIPVGSNLPTAPSQGERDLRRVIYFGLIRPRKGLEDFFELARLSREQGAGFTFEVVGAVDERRHDYAQSLRASNPDVIWTLGLSAPDAASRIASSRAAYLPYPGGASERRGSLLAVLQNSVPVVTTSGAHTSAALADCVMLASGASEALERLRELQRWQPEELLSKAAAYVEARSWRTIADAHAELYNELIASKTSLKRGR